MPPVVSVVIPAFNCARFIADAIASVRAQTAKDLEIIVVDGGSTDQTPAMVESLGGDIRLIRAPSPVPNRSRNTGIRASTGAYVALLDADDKWLPDKLERQLALFAANPRLGLVYAGIDLFESESGATVGRHPLDRCHRGRVLRHLFESQFIPSPTPLLPRRVFDEVGLFDESRLSSDDWDMWMRVAARFEVDFVPATLALYRVHTSAASRRGAALYEQELVAFFAQAAERYPELRPRLRARLTRFYLTMADRFSREGSVADARRCIRTAMAAMPLSIRPYIALAQLLARGGRAGRLAEAQAAYIGGKHHLLNLRLRQARPCFLRAIRGNPAGGWRPYAGLLLTLCGPRTIAWLRDRRALSHYLQPDVVMPDRIGLEQW